ncbi:MAG: hypothetical protein AAFX79_07360 [Planctomycetota bacterium]
MTSKHDDIPDDVRDIADRVRALSDAMPDEAPGDLEARVFAASVGTLREAREQGPPGVLAVIGPRWLLPVGAIAALLAIAAVASVVFAPPLAPGPRESIAVVALDEHVEAGLEYAELFGSGGDWASDLVDADWEAQLGDLEFGGLDEFVDSEPSEQGAG